nr:MAG TPA: hypothetical protein [Caudoviricetes sp.]
MISSSAYTPVIARGTRLKLYRLASVVVVKRLCCFTGYRYRLTPVLIV